MTGAELLKLVRARVASLASWTKGAFARDKDGKPTDPTSPEACRWCILGAMNVVLHEQGLREVSLPLEPSSYMDCDPVFVACSCLAAAARRQDYPSILWLNDSRLISHEQLLGTLDQAIEISLHP